jgi:hypothetical protein
MPARALAGLVIAAEHHEHPAALLQLLKQPGPGDVRALLYAGVAAQRQGRVTRVAGVASADHRRAVLVGEGHHAWRTLCREIREQARQQLADP